VTSPPPTATPAEGFLQVLDQLGPLKDAVDGYRQDWIRRGYSETAAERMAMDLHAGLLNAVFTSRPAPQ
jgi:hypothetical protein